MVWLLAPEVSNPFDDYNMHAVSSIFTEWSIIYEGKVLTWDWGYDSLPFSKSSLYILDLKQKRPLIRKTHTINGHPMPCLSMLGRLGWGQVQWESNANTCKASTTQLLKKNYRNSCSLISLYVKQDKQQRWNLVNIYYPFFNEKIVI